MIHFQERMRERHNVDILSRDLDDIVREVQWAIANCPERVIDVQPDGRVLIVTNLGSYGRFPVIYNPASGELLTTLTWSMVRWYDPKVVKEKHEQRRQASADTDVEDLP